MADRPDTRNSASGTVTGVLLQAGSIGHLSWGGSAPPERTPVPRQLPLAVRDFTGRAEQLAMLDTLLPGETGDGDAVVVAALGGTAGVGKTSLAVHWAHRVQHNFPDGTLFVNLRGYGPADPATPGEVLDGFLRAFGVLPERIPIGAETQSAMYRSLLAERRVLVVLDNAHTAEQIRPLLPGTPGCLVVVTSRASLAGLAISEAAIQLPLDLLPPPEAIDLVRRIVGGRAEAEPDAVIELTRVCARLPLALRIAASRVASRPHLSVADVLAELADHRRRLDVLSSSADERTAVRTVFDWSYRRLSAGQARLFRRLGLHPGPQISTHAAAAVAECDVEQAGRLLDVLAEAHLIEPVAPGRYHVHDLLRAYAADRVGQEERPDERDQARRALLTWYAHTAKQAHDLFLPSPTLPPILDRGQRPGPPLALTDYHQALAWVDIEWRNLAAAVHDAAADDNPQLAVQLVVSTLELLLLRAQWDDLLDLCAAGRSAAQRSGDRAGETWILLGLALAQASLSRWQDAFESAHRALAMARELQDPFLEANALKDLGRGLLFQGRCGEALDHFRLALPLSRGLDRGRLEAFVQGGLSETHTCLGEFDLGLACAERSAALYRQAGDPLGEPSAWYRMALAWQGLADHAKAIELCEQAITTGRGYSAYPPDIAATLGTMGTSLLATAEPERAVACWREALEIFEEFADPRAATLRDRLRELGDPPDGSC